MVFCKKKKINYSLSILVGSVSHGWMIVVVVWLLVEELKQITQIRKSHHMMWTKIRPSPPHAGNYGNENFHFEYIPDHSFAYKELLSSLLSPLSLLLFFPSSGRRCVLILPLLQLYFKLCVIFLKFDSGVCYCYFALLLHFSISLNIQHRIISFFKTICSQKECKGSLFSSS